MGQGSSRILDSIVEGTNCKSRDLCLFLFLNFFSLLLFLNIPHSPMHLHLGEMSLLFPLDRIH